jgi:exonuclease SbcC
MIPRTIQIKNFLSYGTTCPPISFEHHNLICLSGNNGHGKSALLDAMTWALWGCARKIQNSVRADQGLLRLGTTDMMVIFDCIIQNTTYRIKREFEIVYGKPKTTLDFGIISPDGTIQTLTEKTMRETQARINATIGLDYDTFINSSFLRQGNANEFSKKSPKERKEIISTILGLNLYDALKRAALDKEKVAAQEIAATQTLLTHTRTEQEALTLFLLSQKEFQEKINTATAHIRDTEATRMQTQAAAAQKEAEKQKLFLRYQEIESQKKRYEHATQELVALARQWRITRRYNTDANRAALVQKQLQEARTRQDALRIQTTVYHQTKELLQQQTQKLMEFSHTIATQCTQIKNEQMLILERLTASRMQLDEQLRLFTAEEKKNSDAIKISTKTVTETTTLIAEMHAKHKDVDALQKGFDKRKEFYHRWTTLGNCLRTEQQTQLKRLQLTQDIKNPSCPFCEQSLSASRKRFLETKLEVGMHMQMHQLERFTHILPRLKTILITEHTALQKIAEEKSALRTLEHTRSQEETALKQYTALQTELGEKKNIFYLKKAELTKQHAALAQLHTQEPSTPELIALRATEDGFKKNILDTQAKLASLNYDQATATSLDKQVRELQESLEIYEKQTQALLLQQERAITISQLVQKLKVEKKELTAAAPVLLQLKSCTKSLEEFQKKIAAIAAIEHHVRAEYQALLIKQGTYDAASARNATTQKLIIELEEKLKKAEIIVHDYHTIAQAVGKDGIQALLIEEAIPEIEEYANHLLSKLTNNTAHILIESLRDLKSGGTKETLDIKISDTQGIRPYEMFSGGEAFRIDIALRIAISKLLAHRAGTALQTLIIDEGFGSQDEDGLQAMIDVLHALQSEFAHIIVVSHLPVMKDQFPVHFVVEKGSQGSMVRVIEQG